MTKLYIREETLRKLELCQLAREPIEDDRFRPLDFYNNVIKLHPNNATLAQYATILYYYGIHTRRLYESVNTPEMQRRYQEHEQIHSQVIEIREQLLDILEKIELGEMPQFYVTNEQGKKRRLISSLEDKQSDLRELIGSHYKQSLCKLYNGYKGAEEKKLISSDITLEYLKEWSSTSRELYEHEVGNHIGRPLSLEMLFSHRSIQKLSFLLRIDALLQDRELYANLSDIALCADDYRFIYNFLDYFDLLFHDKTKIATTQPDDLIKVRYSYFKKGSFPQELVNEIEEIEIQIHNYSVDNKVNQFITKGIKVKN